METEINSKYHLSIDKWFIESETSIFVYILVIAIPRKTFARDRYIW